MDNQKLVNLAQKLGVRISNSGISKEQLAMGVKDELTEHGKDARFPVVKDNDPESLVKIALAHLVKDKKYYLVDKT